MEKGNSIQREITDKLIFITKENPVFSESAKNITLLLAQMRADDLESYKHQNPSGNYFNEITDILKNNVEKSIISREQALDLVYSVGNLRQVDFDYTKEFLNDLSGRFKKIHEMTQDIQKTLDHACGKTPREDKYSFMKALGNIFSWRKNENNEKKKLKM